jgi:hypothetical protein
MRVTTFGSLALAGCALAAIFGSGAWSQGVPNANYEKRIVELEARLAKMEAAQKPPEHRPPRPTLKPNTAPRKNVQIKPPARANLGNIAPHVQAFDSYRTALAKLPRAAPSPTWHPVQIDLTASTLQALQQNVNSLNTSVQQITTQLQKTQTEVGLVLIALNGEGSTATNTAASLSSTLSNLSTALTTLQTSVQNLQQQVTTDEGNIQTLTNEVNNQVFPEQNNTESNIATIVEFMYCTSWGFGFRPFKDVPGDMNGNQATWNMTSC